MSRPRLLDLFSGAGGAGEGYRRAGFDVTGVDRDADALAAYPGDTVLADAVEVLADLDYLRTFDAVHASPPCQHYSTMTRDRDRHADLLPYTVRQLHTARVPYIVENVPRAPIPDALVLCGTMFGLTADDPDLGETVELRRHRLFTGSPVFLYAPGPCRHRYRPAGVYGLGGRSVRRDGRGYKPAHRVREHLLGVDWMNTAQLSQAIPPAYTAHLGELLLDHLNRAASEVPA